MIKRVSYTHLRCLECNQWVNKSFKARTWSGKVTLAALPEVGHRCHTAHRASPGWPTREKTLFSETPSFLLECSGKSCVLLRECSCSVEDLIFPRGACLDSIMEIRGKTLCV